MQPPDLISVSLTWVVANWGTLAVLGTLGLGFWRLGRVIERWEQDSQTQAKLVKIHSLIHPNHARLLYNQEIRASDINEDSVDKCNRRGT